MFQVQPFVTAEEQDICSFERKVSIHVVEGSFEEEWVLFDELSGTVSIQAPAEALPSTIELTTEVTLESRKPIKKRSYITTIYIQEAT